MSTLLVDAGGTHLRTAWSNGEVAYRDADCQEADNFSSLLDALDSRCKGDQQYPDTAAIAVAGPIRDDHITFTNRDWQFSQRSLKQALGLKRLIVMNDFAAVALALPWLGADNIDVIKQGEPHGESHEESRGETPMLAIGPGTGLGISAAIPLGDRWIALPGEGGHSVAALNGLLTNQAQNHLKETGNETWEDVLSGRGIVRLHEAIFGVSQYDTPQQVSDAAKAGKEDAIETLSCFSAILGRRAADAALLYGAWGGVYLAGGVVTALGTGFNKEAFNAAFLSEKNAQRFLNEVPIARITDPYPALSGLAYAASIKQIG